MKPSYLRRQHLGWATSGWFILTLVGALAIYLLSSQITLFQTTFNQVITNLAPDLPKPVPPSQFSSLIIITGIAFALTSFQFAVRLSYWKSALLFLVIISSVVLAAVWQFTKQPQQLPVFELISILLLSLLAGWMERYHQSAWTDLKRRSEVWGLSAAEQALNNNLLAQAFATIQQLSNQERHRELAYRVAEQAERKRDYSLASQIYRWLLNQSRQYRDCKDKLQQLQQVTQPSQSLSGTIALDRTMAMSDANLQPPTLGRYRIDSVLGKGAMGVVYRGSDPAINREVAIKTLALEQEFEGSAKAQARERFFREAETAGKLSHPNIVTIYDVGEEHDLAFIAMDLLTGVPLDEHISEKKLLKAALVYQIIYQVATGLAYAHKQGVVHRDIKPGNLIFDDEKQKVIITDFGIAHLTDQSKTRTGAILGSPFYMSPEQIKGQRVDGRSDIFSLGVTLFQLLTGKLPFTGDSLATVALKITSEKHTPIRKVRPNLPASASRIVNKALQKEAKDRYQSIEELKDALAKALKRDFNTDPVQYR